MARATQTSQTKSGFNQPVALGSRVEIVGDPIQVTLRSRRGTVVRPDQWADCYIIELDEPAIYHGLNGSDEDLPEIREAAHNLIVLPPS